MEEIIYISLDEAREEIKKRWNNVELRKKIEAELGDRFIPQFKNGPRGVLTRQISSPDNGFTFFYQCSKYVGVNPLTQEFWGDMFTHMNEEKKGYGRLRLTLENGEKKTADIMDFGKNERKILGECVLKSGEKLVDFHHKLLDFSGYSIEFFDNTDWYHSIGKAADYYYPLLLHYIAHGVLFETFFDEDDTSETSFTKNIVFPAIEKIKGKYGLAPIILRLYPKNQTTEEDFYWWSYPPNVNEYLLNYVKENSLPLKECKL